MNKAQAGRLAAVVQDLISNDRKAGIREGRRLVQAGFGMAESTAVAALRCDYLREVLHVDPLDDRLGFSILSLTNAGLMTRKVSPFI